MKRRNRKSRSRCDRAPIANGGRSSPQSGHQKLKSHYHYFASIALLGVLALLPYASALDNDFVHDDNYQIVRNPFLHGDQPFYRLFTTDVWGYTHPGLSGVSNYYRPLQMLTYRWTALFSGLSPRSFHVVNLVFHLLATFAAYGVFSRLTRQQTLALPAAMLFALHPI